MDRRKVFLDALMSCQSLSVSHAEDVHITRTVRITCSIPYFFLNDTATTEIYTLSLHDALPIFTAAVEQLSPVGVPQRFPAAFRGDLPLPAGTRIRLHVNLIAARFVRDICKPAPVGGKPWHRFVERCSEERLRLADLPGARRSVGYPQDPDVISCGGIHFHEV